MTSESRTFFYSVLALLVGLSFGVIFSDDILSVFRGDPDNIYTLENGKFNYPITPTKDSLVIPVHFSPSPAGQVLTFTFTAPWSGSVFFTANPGSGFMDQAAPLLPTFFASDNAPDGSVVFDRPLSEAGSDLVCKLSVSGGGSCKLVSNGSMWEVAP